MLLIVSTLHLNIWKNVSKGLFFYTVAGTHIYQASRSGWGGLCWLVVQNHESESAKHSHSHLWMNSRPATYTSPITLAALFSFPLGSFFLLGQAVEANSLLFISPHLLYCCHRAFCRYWFSEVMHFFGTTVRLSEFRFIHVLPWINSIFKISKPLFGNVPGMASQHWVNTVQCIFLLWFFRCHICTLV